jgi:RimJ/RimL family protein N-acetyltransferase
MPSWRSWPSIGRGYARVAADNVASLRVLENCGFHVIATERSVAEARSAEIEELVLLLDEVATAE